MKGHEKSSTDGKLTTETEDLRFGLGPFPRSIHEERSLR